MLTLLARELKVAELSKASKELETSARQAMNEKDSLKKILSARGMARTKPGSGIHEESSSREDSPQFCESNGGTTRMGLVSFSKHVRRTSGSIQTCNSVPKRLQKAIELGFVDRPAAWHSTYRPHLPQYVDAIQKSKPLNELWLAGFYFNSSIQRLAACFDRIPKLLQAAGINARNRMAAVNSSAYAEWDAVYEEINAFKHDAVGRATGRRVGMSEAVIPFTQAVSLITDTESRLSSLYSSLSSIGEERARQFQTRQLQDRKSRVGIFRGRVERSGGCAWIAILSGEAAGDAIFAFGPVVKIVGTLARNRAKSAELKDACKAA